MTDLYPLNLSVWIASVATVLIAVPALSLAYWLARTRSRFRSAVDALTLLPLVLPPSVVGFLLVVLFGKEGAFGGPLLELLGVSVVFSPNGAVIASAVVALPLVVKTLEPVLAGVPREWELTAASLGLSPLQVFWRVTIPAAWRGIAVAFLLGFVRALGEFGATLMVAGYIPGRTNTLSLEIYYSMQVGEVGRAGFYVGALCVASVWAVVVAGLTQSRGNER